jgi:hypothetical protein
MFVIYSRVILWVHGNFSQATSQEWVSVSSLSDVTYASGVVCSRLYYIAYWCTQFKVRKRMKNLKFNNFHADAYAEYPMLVMK